MTTIKKYSLLFLSAGLLVASSCKKNKEAVKTLPTVSTAAVTDITTTTAKGGGSISSNGGAAITEAGVVYSTTSLTPTTADTKTAATATSGDFTVDLNSLQSGKTYYVRAYATNAVGTGYGDVKTFMTGNAAPEARNIAITGTLKVTNVLTADYTYFDNENDPAGTPDYKWYIANDTISAPVTTITAATGSTYTVADSLANRFIRVGITPKATSGTTPGTEGKSKWFGPIGGEEVTFTYNGATVTYGVVVSSVTGKKWLDRNLGAPNAPSSFTDYANYGDLFQWGRGADGHQLVIRTPGNPNGTTTSVNGSTTVLSSTATPTHNNYIVVADYPFDWLEPKNDNLWQGVNGINNPCPTGWRIPTKTEWNAENVVANASELYNQIKLTLGGQRPYGAGAAGGYNSTNSSGYYWSSTISAEADIAITVFQLESSGSHFFYTDGRSSANSVRCIKD